MILKYSNAIDVTSKAKVEWKQKKRNTVSLLHEEEQKFTTTATFPLRRILARQHDDQVLCGAGHPIKCSSYRMIMK